MLALHLLLRVAILKQVEFSKLADIVTAVVARTKHISVGWWLVA